jgi:hypothetical protein
MALVTAAAAMLMPASAAFAGGAAKAREQARIASVPSGHALRVDGRFGPDLAARVRERLDRQPDTRVLLVSSPGGLRWQALQLAELVNARGITVRIAGRCASACALLWAAADAREMTAGSRLGLHRSRLGTPWPLPSVVRELIVAWNDRKTERVLRSAGFPEPVIEQRSRTPPTAMSWFAAAELLLQGVPFTLHGPSQPMDTSAAALPRAERPETAG